MKSSMYIDKVEQELIPEERVIHHDCLPPAEDIEFIRNQDLSYCNKNISSYPCKVQGKGKVVCLERYSDLSSINFPSEKKKVGVFLAAELLDEDSLANYELLSQTRRIDFLEKCFLLTVQAFKEGKIKTNMAKFFAGVVKNRTNQQERLLAYKKSHPVPYIYQHPVVK